MEMIRNFFDMKEEDQGEGQQFIKCLRAKMIQKIDSSKSQRKNIKNLQNMLDQKSREVEILHKQMDCFHKDKELFANIAQNESMRDGISQFLEDNPTSQQIIGSEHSLEKDHQIFELKR